MMRWLEEELYVLLVVEVLRYIETRHRSGDEAMRRWFGSAAFEFELWPMNASWTLAHAFFDNYHHTPSRLVASGQPCLC